MSDTRPLDHISNLSGLETTISSSSQPIRGPSKQIANGGFTAYCFPPGTYTPKQFITELAPLLDSILIQLGPDPPGAPSSRKILVDGLRSCLSTEERESTLCLSKGVDSPKNPAREEIARQAQKIGSLLVRYIEEVPPSGAANLRFSIRSSCEGHVWRPSVANLLFGPRSNGNLMQLYNEWLHQTVLLRDGLLPFENFDEVRLNLIPDAPQGTRPLENIRSRFLMQIMTAQIEQETLWDVAKVLVVPDLPPGGRGFQFAGGSVMPISSLTGASSILLRYIPSIIDDSHHQLLLE